MHYMHFYTHLLNNVPTDYVSSLSKPAAQTPVPSCVSVHAAKERAGLFSFPPELLPLPFRERLVNHVGSGRPEFETACSTQFSGGELKKREIVPTAS